MSNAVLSIYLTALGAALAGPGGRGGAGGRGVRRQAPARRRVREREHDHGVLAGVHGVHGVLKPLEARPCKRPRLDEPRADER